MAEVPRTGEGQVAVPPTAAEMAKQTVRAQLAEALEELLIGFIALGKAVECEYGPPPPDFQQRVDGATAALARYCAIQARPDRESTCPDCGTDCPCYQKGLKARRPQPSAETT